VTSAELEVIRRRFRWKDHPLYQVSWLCRRMGIEVHRHPLSWHFVGAYGELTSMTPETLPIETFEVIALGHTCPHP